MDTQSKPVSTIPRVRSWRAYLPSFAFVLVLSGLAGGLLGFGSFTFIYAKGYSYLSDDPAACANCHVMRDIYDSWNRSSHKGVATCNDCHTPHDLIPHYAIKALDGYKHSSAFTLGDIPDPIRIEPFDRSIAQQNCIRCHGDMTALMNHQASAEPTDCLRCHVGEGHR